MNKYQWRKGFTLIELLVIVVLIGILSSMAWLGSRSIMDTYKAKGAARQIFGDMQLARLKAIKEGKPHAVHFDTGTTYTISRLGPVNDIWGDSDDVIIKTMTMTDYAGTTMATTLPDSRAIFAPNGTGTAGMVTVTRDSKSVVIRIYGFSGHIRIE